MTGFGEICGLGLPRNDRLKDRIQPLMDDLRDRLKRDPHYAQRAVTRLPELRLSHARQLESRTPRDRQGRMADGGPEAVAEAPCAATGETRYNSRFVVTSLRKPDAQTVYETMYCDRGEAENWIKE